MERKILIAVDDSFYTKKAIDYAVNMAKTVQDLSFVLFNVQPTISEYLTYDANFDKQASSALNEVRKKNKKNSTDLLENLKSVMIRKGIDEKSIDTVSQSRIMGAAKDILHYGKHNLHDAILLGRRGISRLEETFLGSVANTVLEHADIIPVWAIDGDVKSSKILVAVDGSESALNAIDHISFMVGDNPKIKLTLLHVTPILRDYCTIEFDEEGEIVEEVIAMGDKKCVDGFYKLAEQRFRSSGITENRVLMREVKSVVNVGQTIVSEAEKGDYGIIVVGRRGKNESFFMGNVSRYVVNKAANCAVWLVP